MRSETESSSGPGDVASIVTRHKRSAGIDFISMETGKRRQAVDGIWSESLFQEDFDPRRYCSRCVSFPSLPVDGIARIEGMEQLRTEPAIELIGAVVIGHCFLPFTLLIPCQRSIGIAEGDIRHKADRRVFNRGRSGTSRIQ